MSDRAREPAGKVWSISHTFVVIRTQIGELVVLILKGLEAWTPLFSRYAGKKFLNYPLDSRWWWWHTYTMFITSNGTPREIQIDEADLPLLDGAKVYAKLEPKNGSYYAYASWLVNGGGTVQVGLGRIILGLEKGDKREAEHIDPDNTLDYRRSNLRIATRSQNNSNRRMRKDNTSGYRGVTLDLAGKGWRAQIMWNKKGHMLGVFATRELAYDCYCEAAKKMHGEFARLERRPDAATQETAPL